MLITCARRTAFRVTRLFAKRHYTETHSEKDRREMKDHANEHMAETMMTLREIWEDADPDLKTRMKADLTKLTSEMTV